MCFITVSTLKYWKIVVKIKSASKRESPILKWSIEDTQQSGPRVADSGVPVNLKAAFFLCSVLEPAATFMNDDIPSLPSFREQDFIHSSLNFYQKLPRKFICSVLHVRTVLAFCHCVQNCWDKRKGGKIYFSWLFLLSSSLLGLSWDRTS